MFTGIIEEIGQIKSIKYGEKSSKIEISCHRVLIDTKIGDSIATNGICLTVTNIRNSSFEADIMAETLRKSNLGQATIGMAVNLERAVAVGDRLGGHIVSGHIDGRGIITSMIKEDNAIWVTVKANEDILKYIIYKGSIAIDGISLTVAYVDDNIFKVSIIPHTGEETILLKRKIGEEVNLECDVIGKYVGKLLGIKDNNNKESKITEYYLKENGFF